MSFRYYNAHPRKLSVSDCVKRSIALTTGIPYLDVQRGLNEHKKITGAKIFYDNPNPDSFVKNVLGFSRVYVNKNADGTRISLADFAKIHAKGRFIVSLSGHWTALIDGVVYDTWDCTGEGVLAYYPVTAFSRTRVEKKYCFTVEMQSDCKKVTVYDGNGCFASKTLSSSEADKYVKSLYERGFFNFDDMGEYI